MYRLATLLTGSPNAATRVIREVVDAKPDLDRLDSAHLDRLTVLRSREIRPARLADERVDPSAASALAALSPQQREAWVFTRVYRLPVRAAAKAMDCSARACAVHLDGAARAIEGRDVDADAAAKELLEYSMRLDVPRFYREAQATRRRWRRAAYAVVAVGLVVAALGAAWFFGWLPVG